jgi:hypothetical protein
MFNPEEEKGGRVDLRAVAEVREAGAISDHFRDEWMKKYRERLPDFDTKEEDVFRFLAKQYGLARGKEIVNTYLRLDDPKFEAHKPLQLKWNITKILAAQGDLKKKAEIAESLLNVRMNVNCDRCGVAFVWVGDPCKLYRLHCPKCAP